MREEFPDKFYLFNRKVWKMLIDIWERPRKKWEDN